jgi:DNA polymerase-3 subunit chi
MSAEWWFYHIERTSLDAAVAPLLQKCLDRSWRVVVAGEEDTLAKLNASLWTYKDDSFLPHGRAPKGGGAGAERQPILLHDAAEPLNGAKVALLLNGKTCDPALFDRCLVVFEGEDAPARAAARKQYKAATDTGATARYFQQGESGAWVERKA